MSSDAPDFPPDLAALIGSRICHDLISPIGAIGNGLELLSMSGTGGPEVALIGDSVRSANARIRFFRIAFGHAAPDQAVARAETLAILRDAYGNSRVSVNWNVPVDCRRDEVKAAFLALQCMESALPFGGAVEVTRNTGAWQITGRNSRMKVDPDSWNLLEDGSPDGLVPNNVHFALLPHTLVRLRRTLSVERGDDWLAITF